MSAHVPLLDANALDEALLGWMQELSPHGILVTDAELKIRRWNLWLETNSGLEKTAVLGRPLFELFPELHKRRLDRHFYRALNGEVSLLSSALHGYLLPFPSPIRETGFLHMLQTARIAPLMKDDHIMGTITTIEDVTQREHQKSLVLQQHQRQELFSWTLAQLLKAPDPETMVKKIFQRISAHILVDTYLNYLLEPDGKCLRLHSSGGIPRKFQTKYAVIKATEVLCNAQALEGESVIATDLHNSDDPRAVFAQDLGLRAYICHPLHVGEKWLGTLAFGSRARDHFENHEIEFTRIVAQYVAIAIERARNEAALRKAQEALSNHADLLEQKVQERTRKLQETVAELESFSYSLAHDVRAPLRHIQGFSQVLLEDHAHELSPSARNYVDSTLRAIRRLESLTRDILEYSKISNKSVQLQPVDLERLIQDIIAHDLTLNQPGLVTIKQPLNRVLAERSLLEQCLMNLLENARKFVRVGVDPRIVVRTELIENEKAPAAENPADKSHPLRDHNASWVRIWVEDNGIGISPEFHNKIFGIFERLSQQQDGTGIGLAIVSKAIQRMGGRFGVESEKGKGSRFWLELPAAD